MRPEHSKRYSRFVRISKRFVIGSASLLMAGCLAVVVNFFITLQQEIRSSRGEMAEFRRVSDEQRDVIDRLEGMLGDVGRELTDVKELEAKARERLLSEIESRAGTQTEKLKTEFEQLEESLQALRADAEERDGLLAASKVSSDLQLRYRELMSPTVRINALHEVGSGTILWSKARGRRATTYVLTAWHIVQDNVGEDGSIVPLDVDFYKAGEQIRTEPATIVAHDGDLDLALIEIRGYHVYARRARLPHRKGLSEVQVFSKVYAIGCPLGYSPLPTSGELTSKDKVLDGNQYWMVNAPTIFGNSGGGIYHAESRTLIGVLSRISAYKNMIDVAVPHMGLVTPMDIVYDWLDTTRYGFVYRDRLRDSKSRTVPASTPGKKLGKPAKSKG